MHGMTLMRRLRPETLDFIDRAPKRLQFEATVGASPDAVFAELAGDPARWVAWFPGVDDAGTDGDYRVIRVKGTTYRETVLISDPPRRWAFRVDETNAPIARALVEEWRVEPHTDGARVRWTFCVDPTPLFRVVLPLAPLVLGRVFRRAMANLGTLLSAK